MDTTAAVSKTTTSALIGLFNNVIIVTNEICNGVLLIVLCIQAGQPSYSGLQPSHGSLNIRNLSLEDVDLVISGTQLCFHCINISIKCVS
jgi:hypothetical protein